MSVLYELLQSKKSESSGRGGSYYGVAAQCGMRSRLQELYPYEEPESDGTEITATGRRRVNAKRAGIYFHSLQEMWRLGTIPANLIVAADHADYDFELALNSFIKYRQQWHDNRHNLGRVQSAEVKLPSTPAHEKVVLDFTGGIPFTMRYDLLTEITYEDMARLAVERQLALPGPGLYLIDYKLVGQITSQQMWQYSYDFQQLSYPVIYNLCNPHRPVRGMLTETMARVMKPELRHYALYLAHADARAAEIVKHGIREAHAAHQAGRANPFSCIGKWGPCYFLTQGSCSRYGKFEDFDFSGGRAQPKEIPV